MPSEGVRRKEVETDPSFFDGIALSKWLFCTSSGELSGRHGVLRAGVEHLQRDGDRVLRGVALLHLARAVRSETSLSCLVVSCFVLSCRACLVFS